MSWWIVLLCSSSVRALQEAVVVGGGPIGLSTALVLASQDYRVKVIESNPRLVQYDVGKAFLYNINTRGQTFTKYYPKIQTRLEDRGVPFHSSTANKILIVPGDPNVPLPNRGSKLSTRVQTKKEDDTTSYWLPRHEMCELLLESIEEYKEERGYDIEIMSGVECKAITKKDNTLTVSCTDSSGNSIELEGSLVVGADGWKSKVRDILSENPNLFGTSKKTFQVHKWVSPATGLRIKVLQFPPQFSIPNTTSTPMMITESDSFYAIRSRYNGPRNYASLGFLPMKNNTAIRPGNIITRPDHEVWKCTTGDTMKEWFQTNFPRFNTNMLSDTEWERAAKEEGVRFPHCQYTKDMQLSKDNCGVVLVGDAIHAFPPDIGQGINAGFTDVMQLDQSLSSKEGMLQQKLEHYEKHRQPEIRALIRLARFGAPYQYQQPHRIDRLRQKLWFANVALRLLLNKITFGLVPLSSIMLSQNPKLSYQQVMTRADITTMSLTSIALTLLYLLLKKYILM